MPGPDRKRRLVAFVVALTALIVTPLAVVASHQFTDVSDSNIFHADIDWLADNGITLGCNPPDNDEFCPSDNVTRQQMAAFMHRLAENEVVNAATANKADHATTADDADTLDGQDGGFYETSVAGLSYDFINAGVNIELGTTPIVLLETTFNAPTDGLVAISATASVGNNTTDTGWYILWLEYNDGTCEISGLSPVNGLVGSVQYQEAGAGSDDFGMAISAVTATTGGAHSVTLCASQSADSGDAFSANLIAQFAGQGAASTFVPTLGSAGEAGPDR